MSADMARASTRACEVAEEMEAYESDANCDGDGIKSLSESLKRSSNLFIDSLMSVNVK